MVTVMWKSSTDMCACMLLLLHHPAYWAAARLTCSVKAGPHSPSATDCATRSAMLSEFITHSAALHLHYLLRDWSADCGLARDAHTHTHTHTHTHMRPGCILITRVISAVFRGGKPAHRSDREHPVFLLRL